MSHIFDGLQRSEAERSGTDLSGLAMATDLLQLVERQANLEWETEAQSELSKATAKTEPDVPVQTVPPKVMVAELLLAGEVPSSGQHRDLIGQFQSLQVTLPPQNRLVCLGDSESVAMEKFRFLGMRLRHLRRTRPLKKLLITSTIPREGKSTVAANLACTLARKRQQRTLLIDGDLRRPSLAKMFGLELTPGICEWLQAGHDPITNVYHLEGPDLWLLPAGMASGNPLELLQSEKLSTLMDQLTSLFDWIIIDSPPVLPLADTSVWSRLADGILLVTREGTTAKRQLQKGLETIDHQKLIGALLNSARGSSDSDSYYYGNSSSALRTAESSED